jgi:hypothetical protein
MIQRLIKKGIHIPKYFFLLKKFQIKNTIENNDSHHNEVTGVKLIIEKKTINKTMYL